MGIVPAGADVKITPLRPETAPPVVLPDYVAILAVESADPFTFHVEFQLDYSPDLPARMARYGNSLGLQYGLRVRSVLLLLRPVDGLGELPRIGEFAIGETVTRHPFSVVKLWEVDAGPLLATKDARLLPWAMLLKLSGAEAREVAALVARQGDDETTARFLTMGSLRYHRSELERMLGEAQMGLLEAILEGSSLVQELRAKAAGEARAKGQVEGRLRAGPRDRRRKRAGCSGERCGPFIPTWKPCRRSTQSHR